MTAPPQVTVVGAGPAGSAAAITARQAGASVIVWEQSRFPRQKVCGEFLSPEIFPALERLGVMDEFWARQPQPYRRLELHFARTVKKCALPETAYGLSRYSLDAMLLDRALALGTTLERNRWAGGERAPSAHALVIAHGRHETSHANDRRLFGFKAHFEGATTDCMALYFFSDCYVGVNCVEGGRTNVCGLCPEDRLRAFGFQPDDLVSSSPALAERLAPLGRATDWMVCGPLRFANRWDDPGAPFVYRAGDALSFVDPFTGTGMTAALITGILAGECAAAREQSERYRQQTRRILSRAFQFSGLLREILSRGWGDLSVRLVPASWLVRMTRTNGLLKKETGGY